MEALRQLFPFKSYFNFLFPLPFFIDISSSGYRPTSGGVGGDISKSAMVSNVGVAVGIASPALSIKKLFPLPVSTSGVYFRFPGRHFGFPCRPMSGRVASAMSKSGTFENVEVAVEIALPAHIVQKVFPLTFPLPIFDQHFHTRM